MNKKANRRAFFVCMFICLMYVSVAVKLPEKMSFERVAANQKVVSASMNITKQKRSQQTVSDTVSESVPQKPVNENQKNVSRPVPGDESIEPALLMSAPLVCLAIKERLLEKEGLIPVKKDNNSVSWKKPIDILIDKDEEGLKNISKIIGIKYALGFLKREGITIKEGLSAEEIMLGKGYVLEKKKLLALYNNSVSDDFSKLFPFVIEGTGITRRNGSFEFITIRDEVKKQYVREDMEWQMPNLLNLPIKVALERLAVHTARVKIHGSGIVTEQSPKPFERIRAETECVIYGRTRQ